MTDPSTAAQSAATNARIEECQGLVRFLARQVSSRIPSWIEFDDLVGYGQVGLLQAARDFDAAKGVKFSTFAFYRIRGAIYDGVNKLMWFRAARDPECKYDQMADSLLETTAGESTSTGGGGLIHDAGWFSRSVGALAISYLTSVDSAGPTPEVADRATKAPWSGIVERETHDKLNEVINRLPSDSAALIRAVYYDDQTLQEAANRLKISKSWASRMHARALEQMARYMSHEN